MSEIKEFYADKTVLVTGGTGFLGKMTVEKLLRTCDPKRIFLLFRSKKGETPNQRLEKYFDSPMFESLKELKPDFQRKIEVLEGDVQRPNMGLKAEDVRKIMQEVEVIFHWAATLNFVENFKVATEINVKSVRDILVMARGMPQLKSLLYVSTAFSHCIIKEIHETFYDDTLDGRSLITCMDSLDEKTADDITAGLLGEFPNSYVYTKAAAENIIKTDGQGLPIVIFRPAIVTAAYKEPTPGWLDNVFGQTGILLSIILGYIKIDYSHPYLRRNLVPADYVVNSTLAAAWEISKRGGDEIAIYNFTDTNEHCLTSGQLTRLSHESALKIPTVKALWYDFYVYASDGLWFHILDFFFHWIPAQAADVVCYFTGQTLRYANIYKKLKKTSEVLQYFASREWTFNNENTVALWNSLGKEDRELFEFDMSAIDWSDYVYQYVLGIRLYILKDPLDTVPEGKRWLLKLKIIHYGLFAFLFFGPLCTMGLMYYVYYYYL